MDAPAAPDPEASLVLHTVRLVGFADLDAVARRTDLTATRIEGHLRRAEGEGLVVARRAPTPGWTITDQGRRRAAEWIAVELGAADALAQVEHTYRSFLELNADFLEACRRWQLVDTDDGPVPNRHDDAAYDVRAARAVVELVDRVDPVVSPLGGLLTRFARYGDRFGAARRRVLAGEHDFITRPLVDSCHTIWFELHEDLLTTMGRSRSEERPPG